MKKVEQILSDGSVELGYDEPFERTREIKELLEKYVSVQSARNPFNISHNGKDFVLCVKSVTYLGNPHPLYKKRIQIPRAWHAILRHDNTFLVGVYRYKDVATFVFFDTKNYRNNRVNNSSAHVYSIDLVKGTELGIFNKIDARGNSITVVREDKLRAYFDTLVTGIAPVISPEAQLIDDFASSLSRSWQGKTCYEEMFKNKYRNAKQAEWPGFYLEYRFETYSDAYPHTKKVGHFVRNKRSPDLDFDLNFGGKFLGDLKMHTTSTDSVLGNDAASVHEAIKKHTKLWYVVFMHETVYDRTRGHEVTQFWNAHLSAQGTPKDPLSYGVRMKHSITLTRVVILELNRYNVRYLSQFNQEKNSNGKKRNPKVSLPISKTQINNFLVYQKDLS